MRIAAHGGNRLHAPENTRAALLSAYVAGADVLHVDVRLTADERLVLSRDATVERLTGEPGAIADMRLAQLRELDFSKSFRPRGSPGFAYRAPGRRAVGIETLDELLDVLPAAAELIVELHPDSEDGARRARYVGDVVRVLEEREVLERTLLCSTDLRILHETRRLAPGTPVAPVAGAEGLDIVRELGADAFVTRADNVFDPDGGLSGPGKELERMRAEGGLPLGVVLEAGNSVPLAAVADVDLVRAACVQSVLDVQALTRGSWTWIDESFAGRETDTARFSLGYAKANPYAHVFQDDGVHVRLLPYDGPLTAVSSAPGSVERRVEVLQERSWFALSDWPFYSGGGVGVVIGIEGDFSCEVDFEGALASQATMAELALTNVDPGAHQPPWNPDGTPRTPGSRRAATSFFDPHGAPPFVGVEHDEDDGYRISHNLGSAYDGNRYGTPVGDGAVLAGRFRLDRRGPYVAAYYRNEVDATDWVCVGAVRNDSMNPRVHVRCAGKRWRQERNDEDGYWPVVENEFVFRNLRIVRFGSRAVGGRR